DDGLADLGKGGGGRRGDRCLLRLLRLLRVRHGGGSGDAGGGDGQAQRDVRGSPSDHGRLLLDVHWRFLTSEKKGPHGPFTAISAPPARWRVHACLYFVWQARQ